MSSKTDAKGSLKYKTINIAELCSDGLLKFAVTWGRGRDRGGVCNIYKLLKVGKYLTLQNHAYHSYTCIKPPQEQYKFSWITFLVKCHTCHGCVQTIES